MKISIPFLKPLLGVMIVFALPLATTAITLTSEIVNPVEAVNIRPLIENVSLPATDRSYQTTVFNEPVITIAFDDGWETTYSNAFPIMEEFGIDSTQFIISGTFTEAIYMSPAQIKHMISRGHDFQSHSVTHGDFTKMSKEDLYSELYTSRTEIEQVTGKPVEDLAVPLGAYNNDVKAAAKTWYRSLRTTQPGINTRANFDAYEILSPSIQHAYSVEDVQKLIDEAKRTNGWLILTYHQVDNSGTKYSVTPTQFRDQMQAVANSGIDIVTYSKVIDLLKEQL